MSEATSYLSIYEFIRYKDEVKFRVGGLRSQVTSLMQEGGK